MKNCKPDCEGNGTFTVAPHIQGAQVCITQQITLNHASRKRSPDGATTDCSGRHLTAACYSVIDPEIIC